jgi:hypothetical protein
VYLNAGNGKFDGLAVIDLDPKSKTEEIANRAGYIRMHTVHCGPDANYVNALGGTTDGKGPADVDELPPLVKHLKAVSPLITDYNLSPKDRYLYVFCWCAGNCASTTSAIPSTSA